MYNDIKTGISEFLGLSKDALHVHLGLAIFVALVLVLRKSPGSLLPWLGVLAFQLINEFIDAFHWRRGVLDIDLPGSLKDIGNTMFWPTMVLVAFRIYQHRLTRRTE
jgi:hypothetical protein